MAYVKAHAKCTTSGTLGTNGTRSFHVTSESGGPVAGDQGNGGGHTSSASIWEARTSSINLFFYTFESGGITTTPTADTITVAVYDANGTLIKTISNAIAPPANGTNLGSFFFTANGNSGGGDRCGQVEIRITAVRTSGIGGLDNYNVNSATQAHQGALRGNMDVTDITSTSSQDGSGTHRYGTAGDNTITSTVTHTQQFTAHANQTFEKTIIDAFDSSFEDKGTGIIGTATTTTWTDVVNSGYPSASASYGSKWTVGGSGPLLLSEKWTVPIDNGADVAQDGTNAVKRSAYYIVAPAIAFANTVITPVAGGTGLLNRGEVTSITFNIQNSGATNLTRAVDLQLKNSLGSSVQNTAPTGTSYVINYTIGASDDAAFDFIGVQWTFNTNKSDAHNVSANAFKVSRKLMAGSAVGSNDLAHASRTFALINRGENQTVTFALSFARASAYASKVITSVLKADDNNTEKTLTPTTSAAGILTFTYAPAAGDKAVADATGSPKHFSLSDAFGNTSSDTANIFNLSSKYFAYIRTQLSSTLAGFTYPNMETGSDTSFVILGDIANTWVFVTGIRQDNVDINTTGSGVTLRTKKPTGTVDQTFALDSGPDPTNGNLAGWTPDTAINPGAPAGNWTYEATVSYLGNTATAAIHAVTYITPLTSNLITRVIIPPVVAPGATITAYLQNEADNLPIDPQTVPVYRVGKVTAGSPDVFSDHIASTSMLSVITGTAVINGSLYRATFAAPSVPGIYEFWSSAQLNGNGIRHSVPFIVSDIADAKVSPVFEARAATTAVLAAHTRTGDVLTASANGAIAAQDGITLVLNDVLLVKNEGASHLEHGLYYVSQVGTGGTPWTLTRINSMNTSTGILSGALIMATEGTTNGGSLFKLATANPITVNTTALTFNQVSQTLAAGTGISITGTNPLTISFDAAPTAGAGLIASAASVLAVNPGTGITTAGDAVNAVGAFQPYSSRLMFYQTLDIQVAYDDAADTVDLTFLEYGLPLDFGSLAYTSIDTTASVLRMYEDNVQVGADTALSALTSLGSGVYRKTFAATAGKRVTARVYLTATLLGAVSSTTAILAFTLTPDVTIQ